jgi:16S rRNA (guanine527-N7)-methyltransferase
VSGDVLARGLQELSEADADVAGALGERMGDVLGRLERYVGEIEVFNPIYGLVSYRERDELIVRHILDSLAPLGVFIRELRGAAGRREAADAGSGAGFPGVPLAIALEDVGWTLIERMERRADFLRNVAAALALKNVSIEQGSVEEAEGGRFDVVTFRAFKPLTRELTGDLFGLLRERGVLAAYKGKADKAACELASLGPLVGECRVLPCPVPFMNEERHLVIMRKRL